MNRRGFIKALMGIVVTIPFIKDIKKKREIGTQISGRALDLLYDSEISTYPEDGHMLDALRYGVGWKSEYEPLPFPDRT